MSQINAFYRNENTINLKIVSTHDGIKKFERKFKKHSVERDKPKGVYRNKKWMSNIFEVIKTVYHFIDSNL